MPERLNAPNANMTIDLSICIPTYNRSGFLSESLDLLLPQIDDRVEVILLDNASADDTESRVREYIAANPGIRIRYHRQSENIGAEANVNTGLGMAEGEFILLLADDDILLPGAVDRILAGIDSNPEIDSICLNARSFEKDISEPTRPVYDMQADILLESRDDSLAHLGTMITFVSALVVRRRIAQSADYGKRIGTRFIQSYVFLDALNLGRGTLCIAEPLVCMRGGNTGGYDFYEVFVTSFNDLMRHAIRLGFSRGTVDSVLKRHLRRFIFDLTCGFKMRGAIGGLKPRYADGARRLLRVYGPDPFLLLVIFPLMIVPQSLLQGIRRLYRRLRPNRVVGQPSPEPSA